MDNSIISDNRWRSPTNNPVWANYSTDQKIFNFTGHMFNVKLEEKSLKVSFKTLPIKIQRSKTRQPPSLPPPLLLPPSPIVPLTILIKLPTHQKLTAFLWIPNIYRIIYMFRSIRSQVFLKMLQSTSGGCFCLLVLATTFTELDIHLTNLKHKINALIQKLSCIFNFPLKHLTISNTVM